MSMNRIWCIFLLCWSSLHAMEQEIPNVLLNVIANELFDRDMTVQRADLVGFPVYMRNDLWTRIKDLKKSLVGTIAIKNKVGAVMDLYLQIMAFIVADNKAFLLPSNYERQARLGVQHGEVNLITIPESCRNYINCLVNMSVTIHPQLALQISLFLVDSNRGCYINLARKDFANVIHSVGSRTREDCSYGIERKVVLRNALQRTVRVRVKDMTTDSYVSDAVVKPLGLISCMAFMPFSQLEHNKNYPLGLRVWDAASSDPNLNKVGATKAIMRDDILPIEGFASYVDITELKCLPDGTYYATIRRR